MESDDYNDSSEIEEVENGKDKDSLMDITKEELEEVRKEDWKWQCFEEW